MSINCVKRSRLINVYDNHRLALLPIAEAGKRPLTTNGYRDATSSRRAIRKWFADLLYANVAVATGSASMLSVLDVDPRHGGAETLARLEEKLGPLPDTWRSHTSRGGKHLFFWWPAGLILTRDTGGKLLGAGIDVLGNSSYAILPPSVHPTGTSIAGTTKMRCDIAPPGCPGNGLGAREGHYEEIPDPQCCIATNAARSHQGGGRNNSLFRMAAAWRAGGQMKVNFSPNSAR